MKRTDLDLLNDPESLRAFVDVLAHDLDRTERSILAAMAGILAREQRRRGDDLGEVLRLGRVRMVVLSELERAAEGVSA